MMPFYYVEHSNHNDTSLRLIIHRVLRHIGLFRAPTPGMQRQCLQLE